MSSQAEAWESALSSWANSRNDIRALVQIGSRVQEGSSPDAWSDFDYQLITSRPCDYRDGSFANGLGRCWSHGGQRAFGNVQKVTAVFEGAIEADFIILRHLEVVIALTALRWPQTARLWPRPLVRGVADLRVVVGLGWRMIKGGPLWERRYSRVTYAGTPFTQREFAAWCGEFWSQFVWVAKKVKRGEYRAAQRGIHEHLIENTLRMLHRQALLDGRTAFPMGRRAELWLTPEQLRATDVSTRPDSAVLIHALVQVCDAFEKTSMAVAAKQGWTPIDSVPIRGWLAALFAGQSGA